MYIPLIGARISHYFNISFFFDFQVPEPKEEIDRQHMLTDCNKCVVETKELQCPEYCFKFPFNSFQHPRYSGNIHKLLTAITALSSSIGGVVLLCREPGQIGSVGSEHMTVFEERLVTRIFSLNRTSGANFLQFIHLPEQESIWGLVLVKISGSMNMTPAAGIDEMGHLLYRCASTAVLSNEESNSASQSSVIGLTATTPTSAKTWHVPIPLIRPVETMSHSEIQKELGEKVSWTTHRSDWEKHIVQDDACSLESSANKYATSSEVFTPSDPIIFSPAHMLKALLGKTSVMNRVRGEIKARLDSQRAFAIVSPSWLRHIGKEEAAERPGSHIGDILLVTENGSVYLWTIVQHGNTDDNLQKAYFMTAARLTKLLLLKDQDKKSVLRVDCYLYILEENIVKEPEFQQYTRSFFANTLGLKYIQENLAQNIVTRETYLKNVIGEACGYKLSAEQWHVVTQGTNAQVMVVSGPPGSGKTLLCSHCIQVKGSKRESIYVSMNPALGAFMVSQNTCDVQTVGTDAELRTIIDRGEFDTKTCIAFDDAHRLNCSMHTTKQLLRLVKDNKDARLYVFYDNEFQCFDEMKHPFPEMVTKCCKSLKLRYAVYPLGAVHRNTRRVASFLSAVSFKGEIKCLNNLEGDDVDVLTAEKPLDDSHENPLIQNILQVLGLKDPEAHVIHYAQTDIAVLIDTDSPDQDVRRCRQILRNHIPNVEVHSAATFPRTGIVVDCLDSFHGLDAGVCFYVLSSRRLKKRDFLHRIIYRSIYNPKYLAFLASRAIHKAVFVVPKLDMKTFKEMLFDCFNEKVANFQVFFLLSF